MALNEGQVITYMVDEIIETVENITPMAQRVGKYTPHAGDMQRSQNTVWMPLEQEAPTQQGWDLTGQATGILELSVKCNMGVPDNDFLLCVLMICVMNGQYAAVLLHLVRNWLITLRTLSQNKRLKWALW